MTEIAEIIRKAEADIAAVSGDQVTLYYRTHVYKSNPQRYESVIDNIVSAVGMSFHCDIMRRTRSRPISEARFAAWHILRHVTHLSLNDIGRIFDLHHSSIIHGINACNRYMELEPDYAAKYNEAKRIIQEVNA